MSDRGEDGAKSQRAVQRFAAPEGEARTDLSGDALLEGDAYLEGPYLVFTAQYHLRRGYCCNSGCRHCPYRD